MTPSPLIDLTRSSIQGKNLEEEEAVLHPKIQMERAVLDVHQALDREIDEILNREDDQTPQGKIEIPPENDEIDRAPRVLEGIPPRDRLGTNELKVQGSEKELPTLRRKLCEERHLVVRKTLHFVSTMPMARAQDQITAISIILPSASHTWTANALHKVVVRSYMRRKQVASSLDKDKANQLAQKLTLHPLMSQIRMPTKPMQRIRPILHYLSKTPEVEILHVERKRIMETPPHAYVLPLDHRILMFHQLREMNLTYSVLRMRLRPHVRLHPRKYFQTLKKL